MAAIIIDDAGAGFSVVGSWTTAAQGYLNLVHFIGAGSGANTATWAFTGLTVGGKYRVSVTWFPFTNRATNTPYVVKDGASTVGSFTINQQNAPVGFTDVATLWQDLGGPYTLANSTLTVVMTDNANGFVIADAVRIELMIVVTGTATGISSSGSIGTPVATTYTPATVPLRVAVLKSAFHWTIKPPIGSHIDRTHPLAKGLVFHVLLNEGGGSKIFDNANRLFVPVTANPWNIGTYGLQMIQNGTSGEVAKLASNPITGYPLTLLFSGAALAGNNSTSRSAFGIFDNTSTNPIFIGWSSTPSNGTLYTQTNTAAGSFWSAPVGILTQVVFVLASATDRKYYVNGVLVLTQSGSITFPPSLTNICLGAFNSASPAFQTISYAGIYNRALTAGEVASLTVDPFQMFLPPNTRRFFTVTGPTGGGGATITGVATGKASTLTIGTPTALLKKLGVATGIGSTLTIGVPTALLKKLGVATGLASTLTIGTPVAVLKRAGTAIGLVSTLTIGTPTALLKKLGVATGIGSTLTIGTPVASLVVSTLTCSATSKASTLTFGIPVAVIVTAGAITPLKVGFPRTLSYWGLTKPPLGSVIDPLHPMAQGLVFHTILNEMVGPILPLVRYTYNLVDRKQSNLSRVGAYVVGKPGIVAQVALGSGSTQIGFWSYTSATLGIQNYPFTIIAHASCDANNATTRQVLQLNSNAGNALYGISFGNFTWTLSNPAGSLITAPGVTLNQGQFYQFVICYDSPTSWRFYLDTVQKFPTMAGSYAFMGGNILASASIGSTSGPNSNISIYYSSIYNRALSADEISSLYQDPFQFIQAPNQRRMVVIPATPPMRVSVPKRVFHWGSTKPPVGSDIDLSHPMAQGLVYYALLNEAGGTRHVDLVSRQLATITASAWTLGQYGPMFTQNNVGNAVLSTLNSSPVTAYPFTIFCLAMALPGNNGTIRGVLVAGNIALSGVGIGVSGTTGIFGTYGGGILGNPQTTIGLGIWAHITIVFNAAASRILYVNGVFNSSSVATVNIFTQPGNRVWLGGYNSGSASFQSIAYGGIYNRSLSAGEVASLYQDPYQFIMPPTNRRIMPLPPAAPAVVGRKIPRHLFAQGAI